MIFGSFHRWMLGLGLLLSSLSASVGWSQSADVLTITVGDRAQSLTRQQLLSRPDLGTLTIPKDPTYPGRSMTYRVVPVAALFAALKVPDDAVIEFRCADGFSAPISQDRLLADRPGASRAYVAIEEPSKPWPSVKAGGPSAGPFYLVWSDPEKSQIAQEEWPFQLVAFTVKGTLKSLYPAIFPDETLPAQAPARRGWGVFVKNCFPCHTLNKAGSAQVGPDLNWPHSPTEYMTPLYLKKLIRNSQEVRHFPLGKMPPFSREILPDQDLEDLLRYLEHMAARRGR